jgi:membrane-bound lytic murein transglycosylase D
MKYFYSILLFNLCFNSLWGQLDSIPNYPSEVYANRIEQLDKKTPINFTYNDDVKKYIEAYAIKNRDKVSIILGKSSLYFPVFDYYLDKYNLPFELRYLAAVESALDPNAVSSSGAVGLWQIMQQTAALLGLQSDSYIDERRDLFASTDAACRYLEYLYRSFGDWNLALAAYNGGPGMVKKAIARSGGKTNYWEIKPYLTQQMQNYVPAFIAMNYVVNYASAHAISTKQCNYNYYQIDTIYIKGPVKFTELAKHINWTVDSISWLNPMYRQNYIPDDNNLHTLVLPEFYLLKYLELSDTTILVNLHKNDYTSILQHSADTTGLRRIEHIVKKGETLHKIAMHYGCTINNINAWNKLTDDHYLKYDEVIIIWIE